MYSFFHMAETQSRKRPLLSSDQESWNDAHSDGEEDEEEYLVPRKRQRADHKASREPTGAALP